DLDKATSKREAPRFGKLINGLRGATACAPTSTLASLLGKEKQSWCRKLRTSSSATNGAIRRCMEDCSKIASSFQRMECYSQYLAFSQWAEVQYVAAPGKLFRLIKNMPAAKGEFEGGPIVSSDPLAAMDISAMVWRKQWTDSSLGIGAVSHPPSTARDCFWGAPFPTFDLETLGEGAGRAKGTSAKGIEPLGKT
ncbi:unnamed protein product, partial [Prorocentrum cordatum]